jgi:hypothetical protein
MTGNHNTGRKPRYLTIERFEKWLDNDYAHTQCDTWKAKWYARSSFWVSVTVLAAIIAKFITG